MPHAPSSFPLPLDWYCEKKVVGVDPALPGIYEWRIEGVGVYIGQYTRASRPRRQYGANVANILNDRPYRPGKVDRFRGVHRRLAEAVRSGQRVTLCLLENVIDKPARNRRERELIDERRREAEQGGVAVLNGN